MEQTPTGNNDAATDVYRDALMLLHEQAYNFMVGGGFAVSHYTGIPRITEDLDIFCQSEEHPQILKCFENNGYEIELTDSRGLAKVFKNDRYVAIIFDTVNGICRVDESWYARTERVHARIDQARGSISVRPHGSGNPHAVERRFQP